MSRPATTRWDVVERLKTNEDMALYLEAALEDGDPALISAALEDIARARGAAGMAPKTRRDHSGEVEAAANSGTDLAAFLEAVKAAGLHLRVGVGR